MTVSDPFLHRFVVSENEINKLVLLNKESSFFFFCFGALGFLEW